MKVCETVKELIHQIEEKNRIITIKSRIFFEILEKSPALQKSTYRIFFPPTEIGSTTVFELTIISAILKILKPKKIVEIGTFTGYTTSAIAMNSTEKTQIISIDLPRNEITSFSEKRGRNDLLNDWEANDNFLREYQSQVGEYYIDQLSNKYRKKIRLIKCDSTKLNKNHLKIIENADLFFVDGGHSERIIACDTESALRAIREDGWILWHDYNSKTHVEVTKFIDNHLSTKLQVLHIENTMLAAYSPNLIKLLSKYQ